MPATARASTACVEQTRERAPACRGRDGAGGAAVDLLPAGAARNAVDCALWDLEAQATGQPIWQVADLDGIRWSRCHGLHPQPRYRREHGRSSAGIGRPAAAQAEARAGDGDLERVEAVRENAPDARLIVDANEALDVEHLKRSAPRSPSSGSS